MTDPAAAVSWLKMGDRLPPRKFGPFGREHLHAYALASGDDNPLHLDEDLARGVGLVAPPVHGMLLMSCFPAALSAWRPDLRVRRMASKFVQPLLRDGQVEISGRVVQVDEGETPSAVLRLMAHAEARMLVVLAEATCVPLKPVPGQTL